MTQLQCVLQTHLSGSLACLGHARASDKSPGNRAGLKVCTGASGARNRPQTSNTMLALFFAFSVFRAT
jgi:hypothetical protein